ncbi:MAG TPA: DUF1549 and DUF1553 domain-containing protein [Haliangiales bacterium]|nr:DUF1549 and DUF1553 domain-containing protein [Haliangiales bacterium]
MWPAPCFCQTRIRVGRRFVFALLALVGFVARPEEKVGRSKSDHWAFKPVVRPAVPTVKNRNWPRNPIDNFVLARLESERLAPAPEADRMTLIRRLNFDLTGLPPTPEEMGAFLADRSSNAYERVVDRLLASPRYGERWARHWMDAVHFAETHGHDQDRIRTNAWPYRDYLIASFNTDKPYDRFVQEQVAGDVLFPDDPAATVALGLIAAGPWDESSLRDIREDTIDRQIGRYLDRDDMVTTVMQTFTSTTVQCARCHNHKFDPILQQDYYALQAVFAGVDRANRVYDPDPPVHARRQALLRDRQRVERGDRALLLAANTRHQLAEWEESLAAHQVAWKVIVPRTFVSLGGATLTRQVDNSLLAGGPRPDRDTYTITAPSPLSEITAVRLEVLTDVSLPLHGPGRQDNGNFHLSEIELLLFEPDATQPREVPLVNPSTDFNQNGWTIEYALDGNEQTAWGIHPRVGEPHQAVFELKEPLALPVGAALVFVLKQLHGEGHLIGRPRLSVTDARPPARAEVLPADIARILTTPDGERSDDQRAALAAFHLKEKISRELAALPKPSWVYAAASDFVPDGGLKPAAAPRLVQLLRRGDVNKPGEAATPGALACVSGLPAKFDLADPNDEGARRAALARWLAHPDNPLTWRSIVNRMWHHHFGRGLVETPNDFGKMGGRPSHPELLDWLAVWFRDQARGSLKELHRLIVTSATYRQRSDGVTEPRSDDAASSAPNDSTDPPLHYSSDSENRLLSRMNRTRLDAEQVRDAILQVAGCLDLRMGGPSDMQFDLQPGIHVTPKVDYTKFDVDDPLARRRGVYRFLFRTLPDPFMDALDCPAGDQLTPSRNASVTVQQALAMWNNAFVANYAGRFAERLESLASTRDEQIALACELALSRAPTQAELRELAAYAEKHGLANLCRLILNSNEFMFVN